MSEFIDNAFWMMGACISLSVGMVFVFLLLGQVITLGNRLQHKFVSHLGGWKAWKDYKRWYHENKKAEE